MNIAEIQYDARNLDKVRSHGCTFEEIEDIIRARCSPTKATHQPRKQEERRVLIGVTCSRERYVTVVVVVLSTGVVRPISSYPTKFTEVKRYEEWRKTLAKIHRKTKRNPAAARTDERFIYADEVRLPEWPPGKPFPRFRTQNKMDEFFMAWSFAEFMFADDEQVVWKGEE